MAELFSSGRVVDGILLLMLFELGTLTWLRRGARLPLSVLELVVSLGAGAALLAALRSALLGEPWQHIAPWLIAAFIAHLIDLGYRFRSQNA